MYMYLIFRFITHVYYYNFVMFVKLIFSNSLLPDLLILPYGIVFYTLHPQHFNARILRIAFLIKWVPKGVLTSPCKTPFLILQDTNEQLGKMPQGGTQANKKILATIAITCPKYCLSL